MLMWFTLTLPAVSRSKLLPVNDKDNKQARYTSLDMGSVVPALMRNLFGALKKPDSEENEVYHVCSFR